MYFIEKYFKILTNRQKEQFKALSELYKEWNMRINLISRRDIENLYERHVLHSLAIAKFIKFTSDSRVMDAGTGGGFPGIPLAIMFPDVNFVLIDSTGKKINATQAIADELKLTNVVTHHQRLQENRELYDFIVSRAVMTLPELAKLVQKNVDHKQQRNALPNGLISLKGGDTDKETKRFGKNCISVNISDYFEEDFFLTKKILYLPL